MDTKDAQVGHHLQQRGSRINGIGSSGVVIILNLISTSFCDSILNLNF